MKFGDYTTQMESSLPRRFATAAARTTAMPTPTLNDLTILDTTPGTVEFWDGTAWRPTLQAKMGYVELTTTQTGFITTPSDVTGSLFQFNAVANRKYQIQAAIQVQKITTAGYVVAQVTDNSNNAIVAVAVDVGVNGFATMSLFRQSTFTAGQVTLKLRLFCSAGTVNTAANQPVVVFCVNDVGP